MYNIWFLEKDLQSLVCYHLIMDIKAIPAFWVVKPWYYEVHLSIAHCYCCWHLALPNPCSS